MEQNKSFVSLKSINYHRGSIIRFFTTDRCVYEGTFLKFDEEHHLVELFDVKREGQSVGSISLFEDEVVKWQIVKSDSSNFELVDDEEDEERIIVPDYENESDPNDNEDKFEFCEKTKTIVINQDEKEEWTIDTRNLILPATCEFLLFDQIDDRFKRTIDLICDNKSIGFSLFGNQICRKGRIDLIVIAIENGIFAFEAKQEIVKELKPIIQSEQIEKVIHESHPYSDALKHHFGFELRNVFDTQIYDYHIQKINYLSTLRDFNIHLHNARAIDYQFRTLEQLINGYFNIEIAPLKNTNYLKTKPLRNRIKNIVVSRTVLLRELSCILNYKLFEDPFLANKQLIVSMRDADDAQCKLLGEHGVDFNNISNTIVSGEVDLNAIENSYKIKLLMDSCLNQEKNHHCDNQNNNSNHVQENELNYENDSENDIIVI